MHTDSDVAKQIGINSFSAASTQQSEIRFLWDSRGQQQDGGVFMVLHLDREDGKGGRRYLLAGRFTRPSELIVDKPGIRQRQIVACGKFDQVGDVTEWGSQEYWSTSPPEEKRPILADFLKKNIPI